MQVSISDEGGAATPRNLTLFGLNWGGVFAGLAVGIATYLLLMLIGTATGLAAYDAVDGADARTLTISAAVWNGVSMLIAAFIGGHVSARASGFRRKTDGLLHGVVSWGATMIILALFAMSAASATLAGMFGLVLPGAQQTLAGGGTSPAAQVIRSLDRGDRASAIQQMQSELGLSEENATMIADRALGARTETAPQGGSPTLEAAADNAAVVSMWLSGAILLSLIAAAIGGAVGVRGARRAVHTHGTRYESTPLRHGHGIPS